jgi:hypothetical protein
VTAPFWVVSDKAEKVGPPVPAAEPVTVVVWPLGSFTVVWPLADEAALLPVPAA